ncbi:GNAT family N-acetyltransferase [Enterococcus sp. LJL128]
MLKQKSAEKNDYPALIALWERSVIATHHFLSEADRNKLKKEIPSYFPFVKLLLWFNEEELVGFSGTNDNHLEMLFIDPNHFRQGYGGQILQYLTMKQSVDSVDVNKDNPQATAFYLKNGFSIISESPTDGQNRAYPILHLKKTK